MKCPKCGSVMKDGQLYCERCGGEIRIVPEFEPEIENSMRETLSDVATEIIMRSGEEQEQDDIKKPQAHKNSGKKPKAVGRGFSGKRFSKKRLSRKKRIAVCGAVLLAAAVFVILAAVTGFFYFSSGAQYNKGVKMMEKAQYEKAAPYLERALYLAPANVAYLNALSECYLCLDRAEDAKQACLKAVALEASDVEAYDRLVLIYSQEEDYESIARLMEDCSDTDIRNKYLEYLASPPDADIKSGTYKEATSVRLVGNPTGAIFYTLDGSLPDEHSQVYLNPILLEAGAYTIKTVYINRYGVSSEVITENYYIDVVIPEPPDVLPKSGVYGRPHLIELETDPDYRVYYTTDRTDPDENSNLYTGDLWMPVGNSVLRFVAISPGGVQSEITERQYSLDLKPLLSMEAALNQLLLTLKNAGIVQNLQGEVPSGQGRYLYTYRCALTINDHNYYYFREFYEETAGTSNATGKDYVVNYMSGECYEAVQQEDKTFKLYRIEGSDASDEES